MKQKPRHPHNRVWKRCENCAKWKRSPDEEQPVSAGNKKPVIVGVCAVRVEWKMPKHLTVFTNSGSCFKFEEKADDGTG